MHTALLITQGLLGLVFLLAGSAKLFGAQQMKDDFDRFGYSAGFRLLTGGLEATAAALLLAGFWWPALAGWGALLVLVVMTGAVWTHGVRVDDRFADAVPALLLGALAVWVAAVQWPL